MLIGLIGMAIVPVRTLAQPVPAAAPPVVTDKTDAEVARIEALQRNRVFLVDYAAARDGWRCGSTAAFPAGTYWLRRFAGVPVADS